METSVFEIVRYMPKDRKLWSNLYGNCSVRIANNENYPIIISLAGEIEVALSHNGNFYKDLGECILWPNKNNRDWTYWARLLCKEGDFVVTTDGEISEFNRTLWAHPERVLRWASLEEIDGYKKGKMARGLMNTSTAPVKGDIVLARLSKGAKWMPEIFVCKTGDVFWCVGQWFADIIPLEGNEDLLGTMDEPKKIFNF